PARKYALGEALGAQLMCCDWRNYAHARAAVIEAVGAGIPAVTAFTFLGICDSPRLLLRCARTAVATQLPQSEWLPWRGVRYHHEKIRIAYLSADLHQHATALLAAGLFELHDRERFEITAVSFGPDDGSAMRRRLLGAFDRFMDVRGMSDAQVVEELRSLE